MRHKKIIAVEALPEKTAVAAYELLAKVRDSRMTDVRIILPNVNDDGERVGDVEVSIRKLG